MTDLFQHAASKDESNVPLAERLRPRTLHDFVGQQHLIGAGKMLRRLIEEDRVPSILLWGPPGTGKTTLAQIVAHSTAAQFVPFSAVLGGVKEVRAIVKAAADRWAMHRRRTILFIDEIHRFNKSQQDALLPHVERGTITLIGATTENPSFEVTSALRSRCQLFTLVPLENEDVERVARRGLEVLEVQADDDALAHLVESSHGDARRTLSALEIAAVDGERITLARMEQAVQRGVIRHDKTGDFHFDVVSAFIKSMRASNEKDALYWMARMLEAGEPPRYVLRRMLIFAAEDVGNADPQALGVVNAAATAFEWVGLPEGAIPIAQAVQYLARAPKSREAIEGLQAARERAASDGPSEVPAHLRNRGSAGH